MDDNHTKKTKNTNKYQNYHRFISWWNKTTIDISLGGHLPSQIEGLFENKNKNEKRKGEESILKRGKIPLFGRRKVLIVELFKKRERKKRRKTLIGRLLCFLLGLFFEISFLGLKIGTPLESKYQNTLILPLHIIAHTTPNDKIPLPTLPNKINHHFHFLKFKRENSEGEERISHSKKTL